MAYIRVRHLRELALLLAGVVALSSAAASDPQSPLGRKIQKFDANQTALADCLQALADLAQLTLVVDWKTLEQAGYSRDTAVTVHLRNIQVGKAMQVVLSQIVTDGNDVGIRLSGGVVTVTTAAKLNEQLVTRVYDVSELLFDTTEEFPSLLSQSITPPSATGSQYVTRSGNQPFSDSGSSGSRDQSEQRRLQHLEELRKLIVETVQPEIWDDNGGPAKIRVLAWKQALIITAPESVHGEIATRKLISR